MEKSSPKLDFLRDTFSLGMLTHTVDMTKHPVPGHALPRKPPLRPSDV